MRRPRLGRQINAKACVLSGHSLPLRNEQRRTRAAGRSCEMQLHASRPARWFALAIAVAAGVAPSRAEPVDFNYDIRPIISGKCYHCHGPDESSRKAKLRLDLRAEALKERDGVRPIVPGDLKESELVARITSHDPDEVMPPPKEGQPLSAGEIDLLKRWIAEGAEYKEHWAWIAPVRPPVPELGAGRNAIDAFIQQRLRKAGLQLSPEADRPTLLRRLSLDLVGLPPTPEETAAFVQDAVARVLREGGRSACSPRRTSARSGRACGSISPGTRIPPATAAISCG